MSDSHESYACDDSEAATRILAECAHKRIRKIVPADFLPAQTTVAKGSLTMIWRLPNAKDNRGASPPVNHLVGCKPVLDACCGSKMFWFDRSDDRAIYQDNRKEMHILKDKSSTGGSRELHIAPDHMGDFTNMIFPDESFSLVIFDPPHLMRNGKTGWMAKKYGKLGVDWREDIRRGFSECFRVLKPDGTLIFKWNEEEIPVSEILKLTPAKPLIGNRCGRTAKSLWLVFMRASNTSNETPSGRLESPGQPPIQGDMP
jgi:SAM-dependent methyltransferase